MYKNCSINITMPLTTNLSVQCSLAIIYYIYKRVGYSYLFTDLPSDNKLLLIISNFKINHCHFSKTVNILNIYKINN